MKSKIVSVVVVLLAIVLLVSCGAPPPTPATGEKFKFNIIAGTIGGGTNVMASAMAAVAKKYLDIDSTVLSGMAMAFTSTIQDGTANIGTTPALTSYQAYYGKGPWEGKPWKEARTMWWGWEAELQIMVPADSDVKSIKDLKGKTISAGTKGFLADVMFNDILTTMGMKYGEDVKILYMSHSEAAAAFGTRIAAYAVSGSAPHPTFATVDLTRPVRLLKLSDADIAAIQKTQPYTTLRTVPKGTYKGTTEDTIILSHPYALGAAALVPEDVMYNFVKAFLEHPDFVATVYKPGADIIKDGRAKKYAEERVAAPFHAGAYKYYTEVGWKVHPDMVPPEAKK